MARLLKADYWRIGFAVQIHLIHEGGAIGGVWFQRSLELRPALPVTGARELEAIVALVHGVGVVGLVDDDVVKEGARVGPVAVLAGQRTALEAAVGVKIAVLLAERGVVGIGVDARRLRSRRCRGFEEIDVVDRDGGAYSIPDGEQVLIRRGGEVVGIGVPLAILDHRGHVYI